MRILIVDDDVAVLRLLETAFRARGHEVETLDHALGVIAKLAGHLRADGSRPTPPDVCIVDNYLPEMSGIAVVNLAARSPGAERVPIILYSSDSEVVHALQASKHPRVSFALKGSSITALIESVESFAQAA